MGKFCITARHSPLPRKRLIVVAEDSEKALAMFLDENKNAAATRLTNGDVLLEKITNWEAAGGLLTVDVEDASADSPVDLPKPEDDPRFKKEAQRLALQGFGKQLGRMGRRPASEGGDETGVATGQRAARRSAREAADEASRKEGEGAGEDDQDARAARVDPKTTQRIAAQDLAAAQKKKQQNGNRPSRLPSDGHPVTDGDQPPAGTQPLTDK
jgi:hypothetical protein